MSDLGAWHGSQELKGRIVARMREHREADDFIQGLYQKIDPASALGYRGCAIGCALDRQPRPERGWHGEIERQFGIPRDVASLIDARYEDLDPPEHAAFAVEALAVIPVGADLSRVWDAFCGARDEDPERDSQLLLRLLAGQPAPVAEGAVSHA